MREVRISERARPRPARLLALCAAAAALLLWSQPALGQYGAPPPPPANVPDRPSDQQLPPTAAPPAEVLRAAACLVGRDAEAAERLLATAPYSAEERDEATRALRLAGRCVRARDGLATSAIRLRGALAEALFEARFPQLPAARDPAMTAAAWFRADAATRQNNAAALAPVYALADCTAARQPVLVRDLLAAEPGAAAEAPALQAMNPVWTQCVPAGTQLALDRGAIRGILAESLYRWAMVQRDGAASPLAAAAASPAD